VGGSRGSSHHKFVGYLRWGLGHGLRHPSLCVPESENSFSIHRKTISPSDDTTQEEYLKHVFQTNETIKKNREYREMVSTCMWHISVPWCSK
jgi:hypothetical protein